MTKYRYNPQIPPRNKFTQLSRTQELQRKNNSSYSIPLFYAINLNLPQKHK